MVQKLQEKLKKASEEGIKFPYAYDAVKKKPSVTLMFTYVTFVLAIVATVAMMVSNINLGAPMALLFWLVATVLYMMRSIDKAKFDLDDKSVELFGGKNKEKKNNDVQKSNDSSN